VNTARIMFTVIVLAASAFAAGHGVLVPNAVSRTSACSTAITMGYIPDGMSKEEWEKIRQKEQAKTQGKNLGIQGVTTFRSRTLDFRAADEAKAAGETKRYRFPDLKSGNKNNYVRRAGEKASYRQSKEYQQMLKEKEEEMKKQRMAAAKITGASGGVMNPFFGGGAKAKPAAKQAKGKGRGQKVAPPPEPESGNFFSKLFGK